MEISAIFSTMSAVTGIELVWLATGSWQATLCQLQRVGATVTIVHQSAVADLPALVQALGPDPVPVALLLAGRGLLFRSIPTVNADQHTLAAAQFAALLPGSNPADFYCQCAVSPELTQVALVRRQLVDELLVELQTAGLWVIDVTLGPFRLEGLLPYLSPIPAAAALPAGPFLVTLTPTRDKISTFITHSSGETEPLVYQVGEDSLSREQVLPYAAALRVLAEPASSALNPLAIPLVRHQRAEWGQRRLFHGLRVGVPLGLLTLLLSNFLLNQHLQARQDELSSRIGGSQQLLDRVRSVQQTTKRQQDFLTATGWTQPSVNSLCADRLAASLPPGIQLLTADIVPLQQNPGEPGHRLSFRPDVVLIKGQCYNAQQLNSWLQHLTTLPWVRAVRDQNFTYDYTGGTGIFTFTLLLNPAALRA